MTSSEKIISKNKEFLEKSSPRLYDIFRTRKFWKLEAQGIKGDPDHYYDDDVAQTLAEEFLDRISVLHLIGDILRSLGGVLGSRPKIDAKKLYEQTFQKILYDKKISRHDVACLTDVSPIGNNSIQPYMNGGPIGENWNTAPGGLYDSISNSKESIIGIELGFKADEYGKKVSRLLIQKKRDNPEMYIGLLIDGFVSIVMSDTNPFDEFKIDTKKMIDEMMDAKIDVRINDSWNPASLDFLAVNHVKLWIFDGKSAFMGGIGIESQFINTLYDQMDLIKGPFVRTLILISFLLFANQKWNLVDRGDEIEQIYEMAKNNPEKLDEKFLPELEDTGKITLELSMNVPGYVQDAQKDYYKLILHDDVREIFIMAPYFSDDKIARALVRASKKIENREAKKQQELKKQNNPGISKQDLETFVTEQLEENKKVHVIFPKKQENVIIAEVSKYYAYAMRKNRIVETKQFVARQGKIEHEMLHAKQMVVVLEKEGKKKYVKFGGSYNPAGRAHNMWEANTISYMGKLTDDDSNVKENPIKVYLDTVFYKILEDYSEPFRWGKTNVKLNPLELFVMWLSKSLFF